MASLLSYLKSGGIAWVAARTGTGVGKGRSARQSWGLPSGPILTGPSRKGLIKPKTFSCHCPCGAHGNFPLLRALLNLLKGKSMP